MRDAEIRVLQWGRLDLTKACLTVGESKTEAGEGRTIPLNSLLLKAMVDYSKWYTRRFGAIQPEWYVFAFGKPRPADPTRPVGYPEYVVEQCPKKGERDRALAR